MFLFGCAEDLFHGGSNSTTDDNNNYNSIPNFGSDTTFEVITWNVKNFPKQGDDTINLMAQIIVDLNVDVLSLQEITARNELNQLIVKINDLDSLNNWDGDCAGYGDYQLAYIYKTGVVEINNIYEIYTTSQYWSAFPRSPMVMDINFMGEKYFLINNHFKCCGDGILDFNNESDEEKRRYNATNLLKEYIDTELSENNVLVVGDLNDDIAETLQNNVFQMILDDSDNYLFVDLEIANGSIDEWSYPSWPSHLDHILITNDLFNRLDFLKTQTILIDDFLNGGWNTYNQYISDHRPVGMRIGF